MTPLETLKTWREEARAAGAPEPDAMALATVDADARPAVRFVLCRGIDERGVSFFTNYGSRKARELSGRPFAAGVFHWAATQHQVRVEGSIERLDAAASDAYFHSRARGSQLASSVSPQSTPIDDLGILRERMRALDESLHGEQVPRPATWGGYLIRASVVELWTGGKDRLHDRIRYERQGDLWIAQRLAP